MGNRSFLSRRQTIIAYQNLHRNLQKCGNDTDMDRLDHHPVAKGNEGNRKIRMASVQPGRLYQAKYLC